MKYWPRQQLRESVVMETAALSLLTGVLSLSMESLGTSAVMEAAGFENPRDPAAKAASPPTEIVLSLSSVGMGVLVVMTAVGSESPRDPAVRASSPPDDTVLSLSSKTMGVPAALASADGATSLLTDAVLSLSSETALTATPATVS